MQYLDVISKTTEWSLFISKANWNSKAKPFSITVIQVYSPTTNAKEAEVEWFYEDLQDLLELTQTHTHTQVLFIIGDENANAGSHLPGIIGKFGLGVQNEAGQRLTELVKRPHWP